MIGQIIKASKELNKLKSYYTFFKYIVVSLKLSV